MTPAPSFSKSAGLALLLVASSTVVTPRADAVVFTRSVISASATQAAGIVAADVDRDGDLDVVTAEYSIDTVAWYENKGGSPLVWIKHVIDAGAMGPITVACADFDGDGDIDVVSANFNDEGIAWYENRGPSLQWTKRVISNFWVGAWGVAAADLDGDGDIDAIGGLLDTGCGPPLDCRGVEWYENDGSRPPAFIIHGVSPGLVDAQSVQPADVDGDGDTDILSVDAGNDRVLWFENGGGHPPAWTERIVTAAVDDPRTLFAADLDGDGDKDVLSASVNDDRVAWYENDGAAPPQWTSHTIAADRDGAFSGCAADLDGDGHMDVIAGSWFDSKIVWYQNLGGSPLSFFPRDVGICGGPEALFAAKVDGDADVDVLAAANAGSQILFFENHPSDVAVDAGAAGELTLIGISPNPGRGAIRFRFRLANREPARIELLDVAGRRVTMRDVSDLGPGAHQVELGSGLRAGVYLVRLTQGSEVRNARAAVLE